MGRNTTMNPIYQDDIFQLGIIINFMLQVGTWVFLWLRVKPTHDPIALQYNIYFGISYIGEWYNMFIIPLIGLFIFILNYILSFAIYKKDMLAAYFLMISTVAIQIILLFSAH